MCRTLRMIFIVVVFCYLIILLKKNNAHFWFIFMHNEFFVIFGFYNTYNIPRIIVSRCMCKCLIRNTFTYICINTCIHLIPLILLLFSCITLLFGLRLINKCNYVYVYFFIVCSNILSHMYIVSYLCIKQFSDFCFISRFLKFSLCDYKMYIIYSSKCDQTQ